MNERMAIAENNRRAFWLIAIVVVVLLFPSTLSLASEVGGYVSEKLMARSGISDSNLVIGIGNPQIDIGPITEAGAEGEVPEFVPPTEDVGPMVTTGVEGTGFPLYGLFKSLLNQWSALGGPSISMPYFWKLVAVIIGWIFGTAIMLLTRNSFFGIIAYFIGFAIPAGAMGGVLDLWVPIVYGLGAICISLLTAKWGASSL